MSLFFQLIVTNIKDYLNNHVSHLTGTIFCQDFHTFLNASKESLLDKQGLVVTMSVNANNLTKNVTIQLDDTFIL